MFKAKIWYTLSTFSAIILESLRFI